MEWEESESLMKKPCFGNRFFSSRSIGTMSVTWRRELLCSPVGLTPVFMPSISFWRIPGAKAAIDKERFKKV